MTREHITLARRVFSVGNVVAWIAFMAIPEVHRGWRHAVVLAAIVCSVLNLAFMYQESRAEKSGNVGLV
jgi:membrane-bound metal-dependent hydrolase YbcI (DUF457 family)